MKKRYLFVSFLLLMSVFCMNAQQSITQTYSAGDIPTSYQEYDDTCNGTSTTLTVTLPAGGPWEVTGIDIAYDMTASSVANAWMSEQESKIAFLNTGVEEIPVDGSGTTAGTYNYSRSGVGIANGYYSGNTQLNFAMYAQRSYGSSAPNDGCGTYYNKVDNNTWEITVHYQAAPSCIDPQMVEATALTYDSIELDWDPVDNSYNSWNIEYGPAGFTQGNGTTITATSFPTTIQGLTQLTEYDFYVQSDCGGAGTSNFVGPASETTLADCSVYALAVNSTTAGSVCGEGSATLTATASGTGTDIYWYDSANGGTYLGSGATFETPEINQNTSFWVSEVVSTGSSASLGPVDPTIGSTSSSTIDIGTQQLFFDVITQTTILSVDVYPDSAVGTISGIEIRDSSGATVAVVPYTVQVTGGSTPQTVQLNVTLTPGSYEMGQEDNNAASLTRNTGGASYPYVSPELEITGNSFDVDYYYFFYNWSVSSGEVLCESPRTEVIATVNNVADKEIASIPYTDSDDTANFDNNYMGGPGSNCGGTSGSYLDGNDVVYHYTSTSGQVVDIEMSGITGDDASVFVYESCEDIGDACLAGAVNDGVSTDFSISEFIMNDNTEYYIVVSSSDDPSTINYTLSINQSTIDCADYTTGPEANETLYFEAGETLADLDVTGANLTWYTDAAGTASVAVTTAAVDGAVYWVSQTLNGCESNLVEVELQEVDCSTFGITSTTDDTLTCFGIANLSAQATGNGSEIYWYESATGDEVVNIGGEFETPEIFQTTSYWVSEVLIGQGTGNLPELMYYRFDTGNTIVNDASSPVGNNPASINGNLSVGGTGLLGSSLLGTGASSSSNVIETGWNTDLSGSFTIGFWTSDVPSSTTLYYIFGDSGADGFRCFTNGAAGSGNWLLRGGNLPDLTAYGAATTSPNYIHFVYDAAAGTYTSYVDGVQSESVTAPTSNTMSGSGFTVGGYSTNSGLAGNLDEFRIYDRALSLTEIQSTFNGSAGGEVLCESPRQEVVASVVETGDKVVGSLPYVDTDSTSNFGNSFSGAPGSGCGSSENYLNGDDVIYTFTATNTELIDITLSDLSDFYASVFVYESCSDIGSGCVAGAVAGPSDSDFGISAFEVTAGQEYYILVSSWLVPNIDYTLTIEPFSCNSLEQPDAPTEQEFVAGSELSELEADVTRTDATLNWYSDASGANSIPETTALVDNTTYYVSQTFGACESDLLAIAVYEIDCSVLGIASTIPDTISCRGEATLEAVSSGNETEIRWYSADVDGSLLGTGETFTTPEIIETTSYWVTEVIIFNENVVCEAPRQEVVATVDQTGDISINYTDLPYTVTDNTGDYGNDFEGDPGSSCSGSDFLNGFETIYEYTEDTAGDNILNISLSGYSKFNTGVFIYDVCGDIGVDCLEGAVNDQGEVHIDDYYINAGETIYIVVSADAGTTNYNLEINGLDCNNVELPEADTQPYFVPPSALSDLNVEGNPYNTGFNWYSDQAGTVSIPGSTALVDNTTYYVTQTILGCESATLAITPQEFPCNTMGVSSVTASEDMICVPGGDVVFTAESSGVGSEIYWYDVATGGDPIGRGHTFTENVTETTSFWASEVYVSGEVPLSGLGKVARTGTSSYGSTLNYGLEFDVYQTFTLASVEVYPDGSGMLEVSLLDNTGTVINSSSMNVTSTGGDTSVVVPLDFTIPPGSDYRLEQTSSPSLALIRDSSGNNFPYDLAGVGSITNGTYGTSSSNTTSYYYFYNWTIGQGQILCESPRQEVTVTVNDEIPYAPTGFTLQEFCESDFDRDIMIQDLEAVGQDVQWYASDTSSDALAPTTPISNGSIYYASQTIATCESDRRLSVTVVIDEASSLPNAVMNQSFSQGETLADLDVNGDNLIWYLDEDGTQEVEDLSEVELQDQETYYVSQNTEGYCESEVLAITVHEVLSVNGQILEDLVYYPNPVTTSLHIINSNNVKTIEIFNLLGQKVLQQEPMRSEIDVDISGLPTAGYLLKVTTEKGNVGMYKLLKK